ncbi:hypothetical protein FB566_2540 [Stackebrandtia endophytica]|uniref:Uncharacterized protein n=2 Tax=Stackebrandtia endophytica TaxID=1496996 RepID=A0A543AWP5_9ACTN|nr:hypothetical protein FB566_2540 [Stackebrandtia endophytica]
MFMSLAMLIAATMVSIGVLEHLAAGGGHSAVDVVRGYLTSVKERDVDAALEYTTSYSEYDDRLLTADAIDPDWEVESLHQATTEYRNIVVVAIISASDGRTASGVFALAGHGETWQITNPFVTVSFQSSLLGVVAANDEQVEVDPAQPHQFALFPGLYRLQSIASELVDADSAERLLVNGVVVTGADESEAASLTESGEQELQRQVDLLLDDCAAKRQFTLQGCPFGVAHSVRGESGRTYYELEDLTWTIQQYPVVTGVQAEDGFIVVDRIPGIVELSGVGTRLNDDDEDVSLTCMVDTSKLGFEIANEQLRLFDYQVGGPDESDSTLPSSWWATCPS